MNVIRLDPPTVAASLLVGAMLLFGWYGVASAATISNPLFSNGQTDIDATGGSTVSGTFTLTVGAGEVCEVLRTQSDPSQPFVDTSVGSQLGYQEQVYVGVPFSVKVPPNTGTYFPTVQCAGAFGGNRAINGGDTVAPSIISLPSTGLGTVRVVATGYSLPGLGGSSYQDLENLILTLTAQVSCLSTGGEWNAVGKSCVAKPSKPAYCTGMVTYNGSNAWAAQAWLLSQPMFNARFHAAGVFAPTGNWKSISQAAYAEAVAACQ